MSKDAFDKIAEGLNEALAFSRAEHNAPMVEKVARAICLTQWGGYPLDRGKREAWPQWAVALKSAKAAIEAMREPTPKQIDAAVESAVPVSYSEAAWCWNEMIDAALKETA